MQVGRPCAGRAHETSMRAACNKPELEQCAAAAPLQGVRLSYYDSRADVLLMSIPTLIPDHFHAYYIGFDAAPKSVPTSAIGIHQPDGSYKSLSVAGAVTNNFPPPYFPPNEVQPSSATHLRVRSPSAGLCRHRTAKININQ